MRLVKRLKTLIGMKMEKGLDALENPKEMLDYSIVEMEKSLREVTKNALDIATAKKKIERQRDFNRADIKRYQEAAQKALELDQEDLAKQALIKKSEEEERVEKLDEQVRSLDANLKVITRSKKELQHKIELYRAKKEELKAVYDASQAQLKVKEIMTSLGKDSQHLSEVVDRAEDKIKNAESKVLAFDELIGEGALDDSFDKNTNDIDKRLKKITRQSSIDEELAKLKEEKQKQEV